MMGSGALYALVIRVAHFAMPTAASPDRSPVPLAWGVLGSVSGLVLVLAVSALLARAPGTGLVAALGRRSMEIYLGHILVGSLTRAALVGLGVSDGLLHLVVGTVTGVLVPVLVWWVAGRVGAAWLFALPKGVERRLARQRSRAAGPEGVAS
jgi:peptidoglycan/LPS O-acetylase OafA/YrhL